jgi:anti-anti-sigma regulatory factor
MLTVQVIHQTDPAVTTIRFSGELTHESIRHHARALDVYYDRELENKLVFIDLTDLDMIDGSGLGLLTILKICLDGRKQTVKFLWRPFGQVNNLFKHLKIDRILK